METGNDDADRRAVAAVDGRWNRAYRERDHAALRDVLAEDWVGVLADGAAIGREELIAAGEANPPVRLSFDEPTIRLFGETAVVAGRIRVEAEVDGSTIVQRFLRVYARRGGAWRAVAVAVQVYPAPAER